MLGLTPFQWITQVLGEEPIPVCEPVQVTVTPPSMTPEMVARRRREYPGVPVLMHPEAPPEVAKLADELLSTGGIIRRVRESAEKAFVIATEIGILHSLQLENPGKRFIPLTEQAVCPHMKLIRLEELLRALETGETEITVPEDLRRAAERPIRAMLAN